MISKMSSKQLMDIMDNAESSVETIRSNINEMKEELNRRLTVFNDAMEYTTYTLNKFNENTLVQQSVGTTTGVLAEMEAVSGKYSRFGLSIMPYYSSEPTNIFNFLASSGPIFKNNANVYINDEIAPEHLSCLMHDAVKGKTTSFDELDTNEVTLRIEVNPDDLFGSTDCNTIELVPYIPGSFDIEQIRLYTMQDYRNKSNEPTIVISNTMPDVGVTRLLLDRTISFYRCEMDIHLNFVNASNKFPFGFKHIYFLNANYSTSSSITVKMSRDAYIDWVSDDITIHDQDGIRTTTCTDEDIKIYSSYSSGVYGPEIIPTRGVIQSSVARNIRSIYIRIPITQSIMSIKFKEIGTR